MRCLVADASATTRALIANALKRAGSTEVVARGSLDEALAACETPFDLAVVDRDLGQGPGWGWLVALRDKACGAGRLVMIGTRVTHVEASELLALGASAFMLKPIDPEQLRERVQALVADADEDGEQPGDDSEPLAEAA